VANSSTHEENGSAWYLWAGLAIIVALVVAIAINSISDAKFKATPNQPPPAVNSIERTSPTGDNWREW
jgi:cytochrome b